jgi:hypothetical protein
VTTSSPSGSSSGTTVHRLELPADLAAAIAAEAGRNERSIPAQIRFALRAWLANQQQEAGQ